MPFPVKSVANCFLQYDFASEGPSISPLKLQKLVYFMHGWHLAVTGTPVIKEYFEAWRYGPVNEKLYHIFKGFGNNPITKYAKTWDVDKQKAFIVNSNNKEFYTLFKVIVNKYTPFSALQLSTFTHLPETPWEKTIKESGGGIIDNDLIKDYFLSLVRNNDG